MIVKKFQAPTEMEAILKAKEELGSAAVVLNIKTLKQRGIFRLLKKDVVEITAALEESEFANGINQKKPTFDVAAGSRTVADGVATAGNTGRINLVASDDATTATSRPEAVAIEKKLDSLHSLLKTQIDKDYASRKTVHENRNLEETKDIGTVQEDSRRIVQERENTNFKSLQLIYRKMIDNDVDEKYADYLIGEIESALKKESNIDSILAAVYQKIILQLGEPKPLEIGERPKVVFFIGPTGVGKTTTIAKIASKFKLEQHAKVAFITADTYRIAAVEQLNTYASIIDCPVSVVYSADEMDECLEEYKNYDLIMVDTAGRSHKEEEQMLELTELIDKVESGSKLFDYEVYLTLSVTTKYKDLVSITQKYKDIHDWSVIFTKLDETCSLGNILNIRMETGAPLSYTTSGQNVPNDIEVINKQALAKQLMGGN